MTKVYLQNSTQNRDGLKISKDFIITDLERFLVAKSNPEQFDDDGALKVTAGIVEGFYVAGESSSALFDTQC